MILASLVKTRERFMGIGQLVMMPLFFASSALYPLAIMPQWLRVVAHVNPLTYEVHGMRQLLLGISAGGILWRRARTRARSSSARARSPEREHILCDFPPLRARHRVVHEGRRA